MGVDSSCHTGGEALLVHSFALIIMALNNFAVLLKSFIANVPKCKASLKSNLNACMLLCVP